MYVKISKITFFLISAWYASVPILLPDNTLTGYITRVLPTIVFMSYAFKIYIGKFISDKLRKIEIYLSSVLLAGLFSNIFLRFDLDAVISYLSFFGGLYGIYKVSEKFSVNSSDVLVAFIFIVSPIKILIEKFTLFEASPSFSLIPFQGESWRVVIESVHFTGILGAISFFASLVGLRREGSYKYLIYLLISGYLVVFSGSRSSLAAILVVVVIFSSKYFQKLITNSYLFSLGFIIFSMSSLYISSFVLSGVAYSGGFIADLLKLSSGDITAGRFLTWSYHLDLFFDNYILGVPASLVQEPSYFDPKLAASNESYYTRILARYGIFSILFYSTFVFLGLYSSFQNNWISFSFLAMMCVITSGQGMFGSTYNLFPLLSWWFFFSLLKRY